MKSKLIHPLLRTRIYIENMYELLSVIAKLGKIHRKLASTLSTKIKNNPFGLTAQELTYIWDIAKHENLNASDIAKNNAYILQHLLFTLNALEKKSLLILESLNPNQINNVNISVNLSPKGKKAMDHFQTFQLPEIILNDLKHIEDTIDHLDNLYEKIKLH